MNDLPNYFNVERVVLEVLAEILEVPELQRCDNFFSSGGDSLKAIVAIGEISTRLNLPIGLRFFFSAETIGELAVALADEIGSTRQGETDKDSFVLPASGIVAGSEKITPDQLPLIDLTQDQIDRIVEKVPGGVSNVQDIYPLAPLQEGILFHHLLSDEGDPYLLWSLMRFANRELLDRYIVALNAAIARHDILRTAIIWEGLPEAVQVVWRDAPVVVEEVQLDPADGDIAGQLKQRFDPRHCRLAVGRAPLLRLLIAQDPIHERWVMLYLYHHLCSDNTTQEVLQAEVGIHLAGRQSALEPAIPFRKFVAQARFGVSREEHEAFFGEMLADVEEPTAPFGLMDVRGDGSGVEEASVTLDPDLGRRLRAKARGLGVSAASICHVAWGLVVGRCSGQSAPVFGSVLFGRMQGGEGAQRVLGLFVNTLPVRLRLGDTGVEQSIREAHDILARLLHHEHASLALAQRCSQVPAPAPLFTALFNYRHGTAPSERGERPETFEGIESLGGEKRTNYPVTFSVDDLGQGFILTAQTVPALAPQRLCKMMTRALEEIVAALESNPSYPVGRLDILPAEERQKLLCEWNRTATNYPSHRCVHELFEEQAERTPEALAIVYEDTILSYRELNEKANRLAHHLKGLGVRADGLVALHVERSPDMVIALLAVLKAGGAYVPLDPTVPPDRLAYMLKDSAPAIVLTHGADRAGLDQALMKVRGLAPDQTGRAEGDPAQARNPSSRIAAFVLDLEADADEWAVHPTTNLNPATIAVSPRNLAYVMYTSGSTGEPKGVMVEHKGVVRLLVNNGFAAFGAQERFAFTSNPAFDASTLEVWGGLLFGGTVIAFSRSDVLDPFKFKALLERHAISCLWMTAGLFGQYADALIDSFPLLNYLIVGGDVVDRSAAATVLSRGGPKHFINGYGPTESTTFAATYAIVDLSSVSTIPIGRPISNTRIYLLDTFGEPVPEGVSGEIHIGGAGVARGYLNRPELTAERFIESKFVEGDRLYRTGDLGRYLPDGNIEFLGRNDFQVKIRGFRIEPGEIEARLMSHPGVRQTVVVAREDERGDKRLVAYYTLKQGEEGVRAEDLRRHLSLALPEYMVPAAYLRLEAFPLTQNGKLDRKALPAPGGDAYGRQAYEAPIGPVEAVLAEVWSEILRIDRVGRRDNFFELGGHSLLAIRALERMRQAGFEADVRAIFETPIISDLAAALRLRKRVSAPEMGVSELEIGTI